MEYIYMVGCDYDGSLGPGDRVECFACGVPLARWQAGHDPMLRHRAAAESCPVVEQATSRGFLSSFGDSGIQRDIGSTRGSSASASASFDLTSSGYL